MATKNTDIKAKQKRIGRFKSVEEMANAKTKIFMDLIKGHESSLLQRK